MYRLETPLAAVTGIGVKRADQLATKGLHTVLDFLLFLPLHYDDRSQHTTIASAPINQLVTLTVQVKSSSQFYKGRRSFQSAVVSDATGQLKVRWFNTPYLMAKLQPGTQVRLSGKVTLGGKINPGGATKSSTTKTGRSPSQASMLQPTLELAEQDSLHTGRIVPIYSQFTLLPGGTIRRLLRHILDHLQPTPDTLVQTDSLAHSLPAVPDVRPVAAPDNHTTPTTLNHLFANLHFPTTPDDVTQARERLALEELLQLMQHSHHLRQQWHSLHAAWTLPDVATGTTLPTISSPPVKLPFQLTDGQNQAYTQILHDLHQTQPMNRLLIGDVGSGKTVVAGLAAWHITQHGQSIALVAPTKILAEQHATTLQQLFPLLKIEVVIAGRKKSPSSFKGPALTKSSQKTGPTASKNPPNFSPGTLFIGTHALINALPQIKPALIVFDEQHRFGVGHRSVAGSPHILTMTATPIPRTLLLSIFSHLQVSTLTELPAGRVPIKTWFVPESKRSGAYDWISQHLATNPEAQVLYVCPFIDPSHTESLENVAAVTQLFDSLKQQFEPQGISVGILHGRQTKTDQAQVTAGLFQGQIRLLVTTPIVEVGLDLPQAAVIVIEAAERFGLASLHQLRGRVGRRSQQGYCLLFTNSSAPATRHRLKVFTTTSNGLQLAELDLQNRGAGDIFGTAQHGFDKLRFADWANLELITQARRIFDQVVNLSGSPNSWHSFLPAMEDTDIVPLAN